MLKNLAYINIGLIAQKYTNFAIFFWFATCFHTLVLKYINFASGFHTYQILVNFKSNMRVGIVHMYMSFNF